MNLRQTGTIGFDWDYTDLTESKSFDIPEAKPFDAGDAKAETNNANDTFNKIADAIIAIDNKQEVLIHKLSTVTESHEITVIRHQMAKNAQTKKNLLEEGLRNLMLLWMFQEDDLHRQNLGLGKVQHIQEAARHFPNATEFYWVDDNQNNLRDLDASNPFRLFTPQNQQPDPVAPNPPGTPTLSRSLIDEVD